MSCVFCERISKGEYGAYNDYCVMFEPLNPVVRGHLLVVPKKHVKDALEDPITSARTMEFAAQIPTGPCNIITSVGKEATQSVFHLHVHIVPRTEGDGLTLPWTGQKEVRSQSGIYNDIMNRY